jgi:hypothetical protein
MDINDLMERLNKIKEDSAYSDKQEEKSSFPMLADTVLPKLKPIPGAPKPPKVMVVDAGNIMNDSDNYIDDDKKHRFINDMKQIESSGGENTNHKWIHSGPQKGFRAIGDYGFMPNTIKEFANRSGDPELQKVAKLDQMGMEIALRSSPGLQEKLANLMYDKVNSNLGGDEEKMAAAWQYGHNRKDFSPVEMEKYSKDGGRIAKFRGIRSMFAKSEE